MADINTNIEANVDYIRSNKMDTFNDFYNRLLQQQKQVDALYKLSGYEPAVKGDYESRLRQSRSSPTIAMGKS